MSLPTSPSICLAALTMAVLPLSGGTALAQDAGGGAVEAVTSEFGEPLFVNGEHISDLAIKRHLIYGPARNMLESTKLAVLVEQERLLREQSGEDVSRYLVSEEEFEKARKAEIDQFIQRYPGLDLQTEISRAYKTVDWYERSLRQTLEFDKMFFLGDPNDWPDITKEAVYAGSPQVDLVKDAADNYQRRLQVAAEKEIELPPEDDMFMGLLRDYVISALTGLVDIKTAVDGLPPELVMTIEGGGFRKELRTDDLFEQNRSAITDHEIEQAKIFLALTTAARQKLEAEGFLLSDEAFQQQLMQMMGELESSMFTFDFLAVQGHQFPSTNAYQTHMRLVESMRSRLAEDVAISDGNLSEALTDHLRIANSIMGLARVDAEVLLVSAFDFPKNAWKENGWETARTRALELKAEIDAHRAALADFQKRSAEAAAAGKNVEGEPPMAWERYWSQLLDLNSEFWDPPMPVSGKMPPMVGMKLKGRFGAKTRNDLERDLGESPFTHFQSGGSVVDAAFFDLDVGDVELYKGPKGYYILYLKSRTPATNPLNPRDARHQELLTEDYLRRALVGYAHEALAEAEVHGLGS